MKPIIIASLALVSTVFIGMAQAESCPPTVVVDGHSAIAQELALELTLSGLEQQADPGCPLVRVQVERSEHDEIILTLSDQYGRSAQRVVGSITSAATVVTSWAKQAPITEANWNTTAVGTATELTPPSAIATVDSSQLPADDYGGISLNFESALDTHGQRWLGAGIAGCIQIGQVCIGTIVRYGDTHRRTIDLAELRSKPIILTGGYGFDVLATVQRPFSLGWLVLSPALLAGFGLVEFNWDHGPLERHNITSSVKGVRFGTQLGARWRLGRGFSLEFGVSVEALPGKYLRYDTLPFGYPERVFDYNMLARFGIGIRHGN